MEEPKVRKLSFKEKLVLLFTDMYVSVNDTKIISIDEDVSTEDYLDTTDASMIKLNNDINKYKKIGVDKSSIIDNLTSEIEEFKKVVDAAEVTRKIIIEESKKQIKELKDTISTLESFKEFKDKNNILRKTNFKLTNKVKELEDILGSTTNDYRNTIVNLERSLKEALEYDVSTIDVDIKKLSKHLSNRHLKDYKKLLLEMQQEMTTLQSYIDEHDIPKPKQINKRQLTCRDVVNARLLKESGKTFLELSKIYSVSLSTIRKAIKKETYRDC
jgi:uncharacterized protein YukE